MGVRNRSDRSETDGWRRGRDEHARSDQPIRGSETRQSDDSSPEELERLVGMLARRETVPDDRLSQAIEGLARWTESAKAATQASEQPMADPAPREEEQVDSSQHLEPTSAVDTPADRQDHSDAGAPSSLDGSGVPDEVQSRLTDYAKSIAGRDRDHSRPDPASTPPIASLRAALAEIAARQKALDGIDDRDGAADHRAPADDRSASTPDPRRQPEPWRYSPPPRRRTRAEHRADQISSPDGEATAPRRPAPLPARDTRLHSELAGHAPRSPRFETVPASVIQDLRSELEQIGGAVSGLPTRTEIDRITRELTQIAIRLGQDRPARLDRDSLSAIDSLVCEVDRMRAGAASPQMIAQLASEVNTIAARLDLLGPRNANAIDSLARRIEDVRAELDKFPRSTALEGVTREIQAVIARLDAQEQAAIPTREAVVGLTGHVLALDDRIVAISDAANAREDAIERANAEIRAELDSLPRAEAVSDLGRQIDALDGKIDHMASRQSEETGRVVEAVRGEIAAALPAEIEGLGLQIEALKAGLIEALNVGLTDHRGAPAPVLDAINYRVSSIDERLDDLVADSASHQEIESIGRQIEVLTASLLDRGNAPAPAVDAIHFRMSSIDDRLEGLAAAQDATVTRIEEAVRQIADGRQEPNSGVEILVDRIDGLGARVESMASATRTRSAAFDRIEESVRSIAERLTVPRGEDGAPTSLEAEVVRIVGKLEQNEERIEDLHAAFSGVAARIERSCVDLGTHAAESAVAAAREALGSEPRAPSGQIDEEIARALDDLRASTAQSERRSAETLEAVRHTLDRLLDRLPERSGHAAPSEPNPAEPKPSPISGTLEFDADRKTVMLDVERREPERPRMPRADALAAFSQAQAELSPDHPIEPGSGGVRADQPATSTIASFIAAAPTAASFIAAARRAAAQPAPEDDPLPGLRDQATASARVSSALASLKTRRRPLLLGLAAALVVLAALYVASGMTSQQEDHAPAPAPQTSAAPIEQPTVSAREALPADQKTEVASADPVEKPSDPKQPEAAPAPTASVAEPERAPASDLKPIEPTATATAEPTKAVETKSVADLAKPSEPTRDVASLTSSQTPAPGAARGAEWKVGDPITTGSIARASTELPEKIGGPTLKMRATSGDPSAQLEVADRLLEGHNVESNPASAALWLEKAAGQGLAPAKQRLGSLYEKGRGVARDVNAARRLYEQAAASGNVRAMHNLGVMHAEGGLGKPDFGAATIWFRMAAERGLVDSQYNLAVLEARGLGGRRDIADAYKWFSLAAAQGDDDAGAKRDEVAKALGGKLAAAKAEAEAFKPKQVDASANEVSSPPGGWDHAADQRASALTN